MTLFRLRSILSPESATNHIAPLFAAWLVCLSIGPSVLGQDETQACPADEVAGEVLEVTPAEYLRSRPQPIFAQDHKLLPLSIAPGWANTVPFELRKELAENWGYGLFFGKVTASNVDAALNDPDSIYYQVLELARSNPDRYPLDVILGTQNYFRGKNIQPGTEDLDGDGIIDGPFLRDADGELLDGKPTASPEIPDEQWDAVVEDLVSPLRRLTEEGVRFNVIQHWSEWFLPVWGWGRKALVRDPRVVAAKRAMVGPGNDTVKGMHPLYNKWNRYLHARRAYYEGKLADAVKRAAPHRNSYNWYSHTGGTSYGRFGGYDDWMSFMFGVGGAEDIPDYPGASLYRPDNGRILNTAKTDNQINDLLSAATAAKGVELRFDKPLNQSWLWVREDMFHVFEPYLGYVKCLYVLGQVGHIDFLMPDGAIRKSNYSYDVTFAPDDPPKWLRQVEETARVYATFTHLDDFVFEGELVEGPHKHIFWEQRHMDERNPGYVLDNPHELFRDSGGDFGNSREGKVRAVARQMPDGELLVCVWAADGETREVPVTLPGGEKVTFEATVRGTLYHGTPQNMQRIDTP